ncbi:MAG: histidinol phosphate phosphatase domain-containing protein [Elusimicrobiota bacterium]
MIDLHTHSLYSDGVLLPSELVYRAKVKGYSAIAITDHGDFSNFDFIIPRIKRITGELSKNYGLKALPGIEITYVPPALIRKAVKACRKLGAKIIVIHGETPAENVPPGTNRAAILSGADILAHPGYIKESDAKLAKQKNVCLEITTRRGHDKGNRHVAKLALKTGAKLVLNTDTHTPENLMTPEIIRSTIKMSGLRMTDYKVMLSNSIRLIRKL